MLGAFLICVGALLIVSMPIVHVLTRIERGIIYMADAQTQALADLGTAVDAMAAAVTSAAAES